MALREKAIYVGLGVPVFVTVAGVAEEAVVAETFQISIFYAEESHQCATDVYRRLLLRTGKQFSAY